MTVKTISQWAQFKRKRRVLTSVSTRSFGVVLLDGTFDLDILLGSKDIHAEGTARGLLAVPAVANDLKKG